MRFLKDRVIAGHAEPSPLTLPTLLTACAISALGECRESGLNALKNADWFIEQSTQETGELVRRGQQGGVVSVWASFLRLPSCNDHIERKGNEQ